VLGEADRTATPLGGIEAVVASWTIESEEDGRVLYRPPPWQLGQADK
jgi:hypothetical protein